VTYGKSVVSSGTPVSAINKTEILLKVALNTIHQQSTPTHQKDVVCVDTIDYFVNQYCLLPV
jgi:hypothetical protein